MARSARSVPAPVPDLDPTDLAELERALERLNLTESLADFAAWAWPLVTGRALAPNVATDAVIAALQAVADGKITRLLVALPPGVGKSTLLAIYAAWRLAREPNHRAIHAGHAFGLAATQSRRVRRLVEGDAYRAMFPGVALRPDESTVEHWATTRDGRYIAVGTGGGLTGYRAREAVLDDPLNAPDRFSRAAREGLWAWFTETLATRLDGDRAPIIVVQQRLDRDDLIGRLLETGEHWTLLELPAEFDPDRRCSIPGVWTDPRTEPGELLAPSILPADKLAELKAQIGAGPYATQYLQRPSDDATAAIKRSWWRFHHAAHVLPTAPRPSGCSDAPAVATPDRFDRVVIACDLTFGSTRGDFAVAQVWGSLKAGRYLLAQWRARAGLLESVAAIKALARDWRGTKIIIEKAANGAGAIEELAAAGLSGVVAVPPLGSKAQWLGLVSATIEAGNALLPLGAAWLGDFVEELAGATKHDDAQDCAAYAIHELNKPRRDAGIAGPGGKLIALRRPQGWES